MSIIKPKVYTVPEFACLFAVSSRVVRELIRKGDISALKIGRSYRILRKAVDAYLARSLPPSPRTPSKPRLREVDESTGYLFPVDMLQ